VYQYRRRMLVRRRVRMLRIQLSSGIHSSMLEFTGILDILDDNGERLRESWNLSFECRNSPSSDQA
jgi:hypothetical protein